MANEKDKEDKTNLKSGTSDIKNFTTPVGGIPNGETWVITEFGGADINNGDNFSSTYQLKYNGSNLPGAFISVSGNTVVLKGNWEIKGKAQSDGKIEIERTNYSNKDKILPTWIRAYKRS